jgi:predicted RNA-binding Zn-ribbon protein involved in translation (DUF1610 family)
MFFYIGNNAWFRSKELAMYCPKCGTELSETPDGLICLNGRMEITKALEKRLRECYILKVREPSEIKLYFSDNSQWFCPECGLSTQQEKGVIRCPGCKRSINEFIYSLIEHHPHFDGKDRWF